VQTSPGVKKAANAVWGQGELGRRMVGRAP
jgi:hypothetical protein